MAACLELLKKQCKNVLWQDTETRGRKTRSMLCFVQWGPPPMLRGCLGWGYGCRTLWEETVISKLSGVKCLAESDLKEKATCWEVSWFGRRRSNYHLHIYWHTHIHTEEVWCSCSRVTLMSVQLNGRNAKGSAFFWQTLSHFLPECHPGSAATNRRHGGCLMAVWICMCVTIDKIESVG